MYVAEAFGFSGRTSRFLGSGQPKSAWEPLRLQSIASVVGLWYHKNLLVIVCIYDFNKIMKYKSSRIPRPSTEVSQVVIYIFVLVDRFFRTSGGEAGRIGRKLRFNQFRASKSGRSSQSPHISPSSPWLAGMHTVLLAPGVACRQTKNPSM